MKNNKGFATVDILIAIAIAAGMVGIVVFYLNNTNTITTNVGSCSQESSLLADAVACAKADQASGETITCASVDNCVTSSAPIAAKWPNLTTNSAGNLSIGTGVGPNNVDDYEVTCSGSPPTLALNCTDDILTTSAPVPATAVCPCTFDIQETNLASVAVKII